MSSTFNASPPYPSLHGNFIGRDGLEGIVDNGAHLYMTASGLAESAQIESHQDWVLKMVNELMAARANIDAQLQKLQDLFHELEYTRAQRSARSLSPVTAIPSIPFTTTSPYSTTNISPHSFNQTVHLPQSQGETWNIPNHPSTSQLSNAPYTQPAMPLLPKHTVYKREGKKVFLCECGHEASREGDMRRHGESLLHTKKRYFCHCGQSYTRKDSLRRHKTNTHT